MQFILKIIFTLLITSSLLIGKEWTIQLEQADSACVESAICDKYIKKITFFNQGEKPLLQFYPTSKLNHKNFKITPLADRLFEYKSANQTIIFDQRNPFAFYNWDNQTPLDLDSILEDPLLFFRRASCGQEIAKNLFDFASLNLFNYTPASKTLIDFENFYFDLYPQEKLELTIDDNKNTYKVLQKILPVERKEQFIYKMPFPILSIKNETSSSLFIKELNLSLQPQESYSLKKPHFLLTFCLDADAKGYLEAASLAPICTFPKLDAKSDYFQLNSPSETIIEICFESEAVDQPFVFDTNVEMVKEDNDLIFHLLPSDKLENLEWKIFSIANQDPPLLHYKQKNTSSIRLPLLLSTYLGGDQEYALSFRGHLESGPTQWSTPYSFRIAKPQPPKNAGFCKNEDNRYFLTWEEAEQGCRYWIFGSNSIHFIPSIYEELEISAVDAEGSIKSAKLSNNLVQIVEQTELQLDPLYPFYRIIAEKDGQFSNPSPLIFLYDKELNLKRTCLKHLSTDQSIAKEGVIQSIYPSNSSFLAQYTASPHIDPFVWTVLQPYLLPENHPVKYKLDRLFTSARVTLNGESLRLAGFENHVAGLYSGAVVSRHPKIKGFYFKMFTDDAPQRIDWQQWVTRIQGAQSVKAAIALKGYKKMFKVPQKWIYPLPPEPSPPPGHFRHNFILIAEEMDILSSSENYRAWRKKMTPKLLEAFYYLVKSEGLSDSVYAFNLPFCRDGKLAFIDTEHHHEWPVYFQRTLKYLSEPMQKFLIELDAKNGVN